MDELKQRAEAAEERASKLEEKLNELVEVLKVERSKASSVKTSVFSSFFISHSQG